MTRREASQHTSLTDLGLNPGAGTVSQTVHHSGVDRLVAISIVWVNVVEYCEIKHAAVRYGRRTAAGAADGTNYRTLSARASLQLAYAN
jgi:hypothetical protein